MSIAPIIHSYSFAHTDLQHELLQADLAHTLLKGLLRLKERGHRADLDDIRVEEEVQDSAE